TLLCSASLSTALACCLATSTLSCSFSSSRPHPDLHSFPTRRSSDLGCFACSRPTTHDDPVFQVGPSLYYCVTNMPGAVPVTATVALTNATLPYALAIADAGWQQAAAQDVALARGVNVTGGRLVNAAVAHAHGLEAEVL